MHLVEYLLCKRPGAYFPKQAECLGLFLCEGTSLALLLPVLNKCTRFQALENIFMFIPSIFGVFSLVEGSTNFPIHSSVRSGGIELSFCTVESRGVPHLTNHLLNASGHVFAFGETRATAIANIVLGLKELHIRGEIRTNVDYTVDLLHVPYSTVFAKVKCVEVKL